MSSAPLPLSYAISTLSYQSINASMSSSPFHIFSFVVSDTLTGEPSLSHSSVPCSYATSPGVYLGILGPAAIYLLTRHHEDLQSLGLHRRHYGLSTRLCLVVRYASQVGG